MKLLKIYSVFLILINSAVFVLWILEVISTDQSIEFLKKVSAVIGFLFVANLLLQLIIKPQEPDKTGKQ